MLKREVILFVLVISSISLTGCGSGEAAQAKQIILANWSVDTTASHQFAPSFRENATIPIIACGDSHWVRAKSRGSFSDMIYEFKKLTISIKPEVVSKADKANGIAWRGLAVAACDINRSFYCDGSADLSNCTPGTWLDCATHTQPTYGLIKKSDGQWLVTPAITDFTCEGWLNCLPLSCADLESLQR